MQSTIKITLRHKETKEEHTVPVLESKYNDAGWLKNWKSWLNKNELEIV